MKIKERREKKSLDILDRDAREWRERAASNPSTRYAIIGDSNARRVAGALRSNGINNAYHVSTFLTISVLLERVSGEGPPPSDDVEKALKSEDECLLWMGFNEIKNQRENGSILAAKLAELRDFMSNRYKKTIFVATAPEGILGETITRELKTFNEGIRAGIPGPLVIDLDRFLRNFLEEEIYELGEQSMQRDVI